MMMPFNIYRLPDPAIPEARGYFPCVRRSPQRWQRRQVLVDNTAKLYKLA
jgi:hypothetical protein